MQQASVELKNRGAVLTTITKEGCMKLSKWCCGVALAGSLVATDAFADAGHTGFEGIVGLSGAVLDQDVKLTGAAKTSVVKPKDIMAGLTGTLSLGYRFNSYAGVYLEQDLGGIWWTGDTKKINDHSWFIGGTYVMGRGIFSLLAKKAELDLKFGLGMMYTDGDKDSVGKTKIALITKKNGDPTVAFAFKVGASFTYYVTSNIGVGIQVDYSMGLNKHEYDLGGEVTKNLHHINPGIHMRFGF